MPSATRFHAPAARPGVFIEQSANGKVAYGVTSYHRDLKIARQRAVREFKALKAEVERAVNGGGG